eukprot:jgi/Botrbrau1/13298/Bobra.27_2s0018.1
MHDTVPVEPKPGTQFPTDNVEATSRAVGNNQPAMGTPMPYFVHASAPSYNFDGTYPPLSSTSNTLCYGTPYAPDGVYNESTAHQMYPYGPNVPPQGMYVETVYVPPANAEPMACLCGVQWTLFLIGWFAPPLWFLATVLPLCMRRDIRELPGWIANLSMVFTVAILVLVFGILHHYGHLYWNDQYNYK